MKINAFKLLPFIFVVATSSAFATTLSVHLVGDSPAKYRCNDGTEVTARYYELSDKSLQLVKLKFKKQEVTLPAVISGSGSRYNDSYKMEWWIKGKSATLNRDISDKNQTVVECRLIS